MDRKEYLELSVFALDIRRQTIEEFYQLGFGHIGGSMSVVELFAVLYNKVMNVDPQNPLWENRDRLIVSKGHCGPALYAALSHRGFFPPEWLKTLNKPGTRLPSHADCSRTPGVDMTTGSLGQGFSSGLGIALANKLDRRSNTVFILIGDGECNEGQVWEAAMFAVAKKLNNVVLILDMNGLQLDGSTKDVLDMGSLPEKFSAFGWNVVDVEKGNDVGGVFKGITEARMNRNGAPSVVVLHTEKGYGYPAASRGPNHHMFINQQDRDEAIKLLDRELAELNAQLDRLDKEV
jgi:transketolase